MTIVPPAVGTEFTSPWTIDALSNNLADVGVWPVTVQVTLDNYPSITATTALTAEVLDPCLATVIQPVNLSDMMVSIYDTVPQS